MIARHCPPDDDLLDLVVQRVRDWLGWLREKMGARP